MLDLNATRPAAEPIRKLAGYAKSIETPATMLYGMPKAAPEINMESFTDRTSSLSDELRRRQENLRFVLRELKKDFSRKLTIDNMLNRKIQKESYTSMMGIEILNPMGLRAPLLDYSQAVLESIELSKLVVANTLPNAKIFFAKLIGDNELENNRPIDAEQYLKINTEHMAELKGRLSKMLNSQYENPTTLFSEQFKRIRDWEDTCRVSAAVSEGLDDIIKHNVSNDIKTITQLLDKLTLSVKRNKNDVSETRIKTIKEASRGIAEEVSFLGATMHLADTLVKCMEDNKEYLRDYLTK